MINAWRIVLPAALLSGACVGPDIEFGEVRTFEVERPEMRPYLVAAGDRLGVTFSYHPERNTTVTVRPDGRFSMPFAEEVPAAGLTLPELDAELTKLIEKHLRDADLTIVPMQQAQQRVFVAGEIARPGQVDLIPGMSMHQALTSAGWFRDTAATDSVILVRTLAPGKRQAVKIDCSEEALIAFDTELQRFDMIYVPKSPIARVGEWIESYMNRTTPRWFQSVAQVIAIREYNDRNN